MRKFVTAAAVTVVLLDAWRRPAWAAGDGEKVGENIGNLLGGWAKSLYVGIAAVVALMFLLNRRFADMAVFMVAALIVGGFVMAPERRGRHDPRHLADDHGLMCRAGRHPLLPARVRGRPAHLPRRSLGAAGPGRRAAAGGRLLRRDGAAGGDPRRCRDRRAGRDALAAAALRGRCRWRSRCSARRRRRTGGRRIASRWDWLRFRLRARIGARRAAWSRSRASRCAGTASWRCAGMPTRRAASRRA